MQKNFNNISKQQNTTILDIAEPSMRHMIARSVFLLTKYNDLKVEKQMHFLLLIVAILIALFCLFFNIASVGVVIDDQIYSISTGKLGLAFIVLYGLCLFRVARINSAIYMLDLESQAYIDSVLDSVQDSEEDKDN